MAEIIEVNNTTQFEEVYDKVSQEHENFVIVFSVLNTSPKPENGGT